MRILIETPVTMRERQHLVGIGDRYFSLFSYLAGSKDNRRVFRCRGEYPSRDAAFDEFARIAENYRECGKDTIDRIVKIRQFLAQNPTRLGFKDGFSIYEDPVEGEDGTMVAIGADSRIYRLIHAHEIDDVWEHGVDEMRDSEGVRGIGA